MRYISSIVLVLLLVLQQVCYGTGLFFEKYDWPDSGSFELIDMEAKGYNAVVMKDLKALEYYFDNEYNSLMQLYTVHTKVLVNTHEAVEIYNKHYMPMARVVSIEDLRVRVITEDSVKEIDEIDLKDYEGKDNYSSYKYFAIEGVEVGSQIEYIYTFKMSPQLEGGREFFQSDEYKLNTEFHLYCEDKMFFNTKSYNGFTPVVLDTTIDGKNHYMAVMDKIQALEPELYAPYNNSLMRVEYKLDHIKPAEDVKLYTYSQLSNQLDQYLRADISKKDIKALNGLTKKLGLDNLDEEAKIRTIEDFIKRNVTVTEQRGEELEQLESILEKLVANQRGAIKLYIALLDLQGISYKYGLTSDRTKVTMDPDFESYSFLENYIFYFPSCDKYMAPTETLYRLGYIPFNWSNNYGLFIETARLGSTSTTMPEVKYIEPLAYDKSEDKLDIQIEFDGEFDAMNVQIARTLTGYNATFIQPIFDLIPEKETKLVVNELLNLSGKDVELKDFKLINLSMDSFYLKPFIIQGTASTQSSFYDKAGAKYLLKIGEVIGEQVEMYQEEDRKLPVENEFNRNYERTISFEIPEGYIVRNLDDLKMDIFHEENGAKSMAFTSDYLIDGNTVQVSIKEYYKQLDYPLSDFNQFRKVINAAADFNKKVLIFEKG
ncbi:MAG: DUF3857 domain-containing protein [Cyclobacteriaceae bacterium]|nr:DUF3857 domain-containing protein [Cyclobacteriaceae bacterium]